MVYSDAGIYANVNGIDRLNYYFDKLNSQNVENKHSIVAFSTSDNYIAQQYVKNDVIMCYYPQFNYEWNVYKYAGLIIFKKNDDTIKFVKDWLKLCENYNFLNRNKSILFNEFHYYIGNDCDNGLFNLCLSKYKNIVFVIEPDEINININGIQIHHVYQYDKKKISEINWESLDKIPFQCRRITPKFYDNH